MKNFLLTALGTFCALAGVIAQENSPCDTPQKTNSDKKSLEKVSVTSSDKIEEKTRYKVFASPSNKTTPQQAMIEIPVAKPNTLYEFNTPIKTLSGKGSVRMPGTELLDLAERRRDSLMQKNSIIKIRTIPIK
ncbi:hypothetical protein E2P86_00505 [Sphingobacterium psychroaquaticum]|uniref:hypothetical protein n=1 Tax=Sphingobacterium psychroaquaticum TaxID=561061 RepID=UPI00106AD5B9|nr:hypothetical protein [Sphingobacterium psychroaquaticum]QBQ39716.1 hypothetical protein E2P86_00505 [Sphingobacterium psychroaquaticum]